MFSGESGHVVVSGIKGDDATTERPTYGLVKAAMDVVFNDLDARPQFSAQLSASAAADRGVGPADERCRGVPRPPRRAPHARSARRHHHRHRRRLQRRHRHMRSACTPDSGRPADRACVSWRPLRGPRAEQPPRPGWWAAGRRLGGRPGPPPPPPRPLARVVEVPCGGAGESVAARAAAVCGRRRRAAGAREAREGAAGLGPPARRPEGRGRVRAGGLLALVCVRVRWAVGRPSSRMACHVGRRLAASPLFLLVVVVYVCVVNIEFS